MADQINVRDLTTQLEQGDGHSVPAFFSGKFEEERFKDLDAIRKLNEQDRAEGKTTVTLHCQRDFYYNDTISITATNGAWDEFSGGKSLYSDSLDLNTLTHTNPADRVPTVRQPVDVKALTQKLEAGEGQALNTALAGKYQEERAAILKQVESLNKTHLADHQTSFALNISLAGSKHNAGTMSVVRQQNGARDAFFGGVQIYSETLDLDTGTRKIFTNFDGRK